MANVLEPNVWKATRERCRVALHMPFDVISHGKASGHDAEVVVSAVTVAHDIGGWRSERLWSFWFDQAVFIMFVGSADGGLFQYVLAAASYSLHDFFCTVQDSEGDHVKKPEAAGRCSVGLKYFLRFFRGGFVQFFIHVAAHV